jgi:hypothetical protein
VECVKNVDMEERCHMGDDACEDMIGMLGMWKKDEIVDVVEDGIE